MNEELSRQPEQADIDAKRYEVQQLTLIAGILSEMINREIEGFDGADGAVDYLSNYCVSVAKRDEAMGRHMIHVMEAHESARELLIPDAIRKNLGLPVSTYPGYPPIAPVPDPYGQAPVDPAT
jgi:hypothetical protein